MVTYSQFDFGEKWLCELYYSVITFNFRFMLVYFLDLNLWDKCSAGGKDESGMRSSTNVFFVFNLWGLTLADMSKYLYEKVCFF